MRSTWVSGAGDRSVAEGQVIRELEDVDLVVYALLEKRALDIGLLEGRAGSHRARGPPIVIDGGAPPQGGAAEGEAGRAAAASLFASAWLDAPRAVLQGCLGDHDGISRRGL
jgi:hypothetical protein